MKIYNQSYPLINNSQSCPRGIFQISATRNQYAYMLNFFTPSNPFFAPRKENFNPETLVSIFGKGFIIKEQFPVFLENKFFPCHPFPDSRERIYLSAEQLPESRNESLY